MVEGIKTQTKEQFANLKSQAKAQVREGAREQANHARRNLGEIIVDATSEYFPEEVRARRRRDIAGGFLVGVGIGFLLRYVVDR